MIKIKLFLKKTTPIIVVDKEMLSRIASKGYRYEILSSNAKPDLEALSKKIFEKEIEVMPKNILKAKGVA